MRSHSILSSPFVLCTFSSVLYSTHRSSAPNFIYSPILTQAVAIYLGISLQTVQGVESANFQIWILFARKGEKGELADARYLTNKITLMVGGRRLFTWSCYQDEARVHLSRVSAHGAICAAFLPVWIIWVTRCDKRIGGKPIQLQLYCYIFLPYSEL